jgi:hypothetical protein
MKRLATLLSLVGVVGLLATAAFAAAPLPGSYQSTDLGGTISTGRYTEGWDTGGGGILHTGSTTNCGSWNGTALGTEWRYTCGTATGPAMLLIDNVNSSGNGNRTYVVNFAGGTLWLSGSGPWANGDAYYAGHFDTYTEYETVQYVNWVPVAAVTNVQNTAHFDDYPLTCMSFSIANGTRVGTTDLGGVKPANYPDFLDAACGATRTLGAWWNMTSVTISINAGCTVPVQSSTWGALKSLYR